MTAWTWPEHASRSVNLPLRPNLVLSRRKPRLSLRLPGALWLRYADRQFLASLFQLPPRMTRFEPDTVVTPKRTTRQRTPVVPQENRHG